MTLVTAAYRARSEQPSGLFSSTESTMATDFPIKENSTLSRRLQSMVINFFRGWVAPDQAILGCQPARVFSPSSAYANGLYSLMTPETITAEKQFRTSGVLPEDISSTTALTLLSFANQYANVGLRTAAFNALIASFVEQRDSLQDYCMAVWFITQNHAPSFLSQDKIDALRGVQADSIHNLSAFQSLSEAEQQQLLGTLEGRAKDGDIGMGPVKFSDVAVYLGNFKAPGSTFRILTKDSQVELRIAHKNDLHQFIMYSQFLNNGTLIPPGVKNDPLYTVHVTKIEIESALLRKLIEKNQILTNGLGIEAFLDEVQDKNRQVDIAREASGFSIRSNKAKPEFFCVMPTVLFVNSVDYCGRRTRTGQP